MQTDDLQKLFLRIDWEMMTKKLLLYGRYRVTRFGGAASLRQNIQDYVHDAVRLLFDGTRQFDGDDEELFGFLCGVIDSLISHDMEKSRRRGRHLSLAWSRGDDETQEEIREDQLPSADDVESDVTLRDRFMAFLASIEDKQLARYALVRAGDDGSSAEQYASALNTTVEDVRNMDRRLRRRRAQW